MLQETQEDDSDSPANENPATVSSEEPQLVTDNHEALNVGNDFSVNVENVTEGRNTWYATFSKLFI